MRKARKILSLAVCISMLLTIFFPQGIKAEAQEDGESAVLNESTKTYGYDNIYDSTKNLKVAFLGGSITEGAGATGNNRYSTQTMEYFKNLKASQNESLTAEEINAGIGGTPASLGIYRFTSKVLSQKPDVVFVEFAVNDRTNTQVGKYMEGIVRVCARAEHVPVVIFLYSTQGKLEQYYDDLNKCIDRMNVIADYYGIGAINFHSYACSLIDKGEAVWNKDAEGTLTADNTHPNDDGHTLYANYIKSCLESEPERYLKKFVFRTNPISGYEFSNPHLVPHNSVDAVYSSGWSDSADSSSVWTSSSFLTDSRRFSDGVHELAYSSAKQESVRFKFTGRAIGLFYSRSYNTPSAVPYTIYAADGTTVEASGTFSMHYPSGQMACGVSIKENLPYGEHTIVIENPVADTIISNGTVYDRNKMSIGYFMIDDGEPIAKPSVSYLSVAYSAGEAKALYTFAEPAFADASDKSVFKWYTSSQENGEYSLAAQTETASYALKDEDYDKYIKVEVTPVSSYNNEGTPVMSEPVFTKSDTITPDGAKTLLSPDGSVKINFWLENSAAYYNVFKNSTAVVLNSKLGINCGEAGDFADGFTSVTDAVTSSSDTVWTPVVGEQAAIRNNYNKLSVKLAHSSGNVLGIDFCAYDEGAAFRYVLPSAEPGNEYIISDEYTQIALPTADGTFAAVHQTGSQTAANKIAVTALSSSAVYQRPMAVSYANGYAMTIAEAKVQDYRVMTLSGAGQSGVLKVTQPKPVLPRDISNSASTVAVDENGPEFTPWRVFVIGINDAELPKNAVIIENLNDPADEETYEYSSWVKAGPNLRAGIGTDSAKSGIDQAAEHGIPYILLDTGWYGSEYDVGCDPRLDPSLLDPSDPYYDILNEYIPREGVFNTNGKTFNTYGTLLDETAADYKMSVNIDIPEVCRYGKEKGVGVILYVNGVFFPDDRFTADELFSHFAKWGVAGVKPGFVGARTQELENTMEEVIKAAAKNKLIMTIHDEYVTSGITRTYPNVLCTEGILGDEGIGKTSPQADSDLTALFTRCIQGPADHTFCYPGKATKAYAVASPIMFRTGMNALYWYTSPNAVMKSTGDSLAIWDNLPGSWDESLYLEGKMFEYATYARRKSENWYIGSLTAGERELAVKLDFLDSTKIYKAVIYSDGDDADAYAGWNSSAKAAQTLNTDTYLVNSKTILRNELKNAGGYAVYISPASETDISAYEYYSYYKTKLQLLYDSCTGYSESDFTAESWGPFKTAFDAAAAKLSDTQASEDELSECYNSLLNAKNGLSQSTAKLIPYLTKAALYSRSVYTPESYEKLQSAADRIRQMIEGSSIYTQSEIDSAVSEIETAYAAMTVNSDAVQESFKYLGELTPTKEWGSTTTRFMVNTNRNGNDKIKLITDGVVSSFDYGVEADAPVKLTYDLNGDYDTFEAYLGVDYAKYGYGSVKFDIYCDGILTYSTETLTGSSNAVKAIVPVKGVSKLVIDIDDVENGNSDWSTMADAKLVKYKDFSKSISAIRVNGNKIDGFDSEIFDYDYEVADISDITSITCDFAEGFNPQYFVYMPDNESGIGAVCVTLENGDRLTYRINFNKYTTSDYLSDLTPESKSVYSNNVYKDKDRAGNKITVWDSSGNPVVYDRGIGADSVESGNSDIVYNIGGKGYEIFDAYASISYYAYANEVNQGHGDNPRSSIVYKFYVDDVLKYTTGVMKCKTPAEHVVIDVKDAKKLRIVFDPNGSQSADWGVLANARFLNSNVSESELTYEVTEKWEVIITGFKTKPEEKALYNLVIPSRIDGLPVVEIADNAFMESGSTRENGENRIGSLTVPGTVKRIGNNAFRDCCGLSSVTLNEGLEEIGNGAFVHLNGAGTINMTFPSTLKKIGNNAFQYAGPKAELPSMLEYIGDLAFHWNSALTDVVIPDSVTNIGTDAFKVCQNITSFRFPRNDKYTAISGSVFGIDREPQAFSKLSEIYIPETITSISSDLFKNISAPICTVYGKKGSAAEAVVAQAISGGYVKSGTELKFCEYSFEPGFDVFVSSNGGEILCAVEENEAENWGVSGMNSFEIGTKLRFMVQPPVENGKFLYWKDNKSGRVLSYDSEYSFTLGSEKNISAVFADNSSGAYVSFINANGIISAEGYCTQEIAVPSNPYIMGYVFDGWYVNSQKSGLAAGESVDVSENTIFKAGYTLDPTIYTVSISGADIESGSYKYNAKLTLRADAENSEGKAFSYWMRDGRKVSYDSNRYTFYVSGDTTVEAVYGQTEENSDILIVMSEPVLIGTDKIAFFAERNLDSRYTVIESGILIANDAGITTDSYMYRAIAKNNANAGQFTVRKANVKSGETWYGRAYVIYGDGAEICTEYSSEVCLTVK